MSKRHKNILHCSGKLWVAWPHAPPSTSKLAFRVSIRSRDRDDPPRVWSLSAPCVTGGTHSSSAKPVSSKHQLSGAWAGLCELQDPVPWERTPGGRRGHQILCSIAACGMLREISALPEAPSPSAPRRKQQQQLFDD